MEVYDKVSAEAMRALINPRSSSAHKGDFGHALLVAGSRGVCGAAVLAARAALRSGVGKLTVHSDELNRSILQVAVPEAMVAVDLPDFDLFSAVAFGPGLGLSDEAQASFETQVSECTLPSIWDADALNMVANNTDLIDFCRPGTILTPHPKEFDNLVECGMDRERQISVASKLAKQREIVVVLKGAGTVVATPDGAITVNTTGNPGMATAGSGDVLTGVILSLLAQGYASADAARLGVYVHGLAGDIALEQKGEISLIAGDIVEALPAAWKSLMQR